MPIRSIDVNWNDSGEGWVETPGRYKNKMSVCDPEINMPNNIGLQGFGGTSEACSVGYKIFQHKYNHNFDNLCTDGSDNSCYTPEVRVVDWWGSTTIAESVDEIRVEE